MTTTKSKKKTPARKPAAKKKPATKPPTLADELRIQIRGSGKPKPPKLTLKGLQGRVSATAEIMMDTQARVTSAESRISGNSHDIQTLYSKISDLKKMQKAQRVVNIIHMAAISVIIGYLIVAGA